jgi:hypothetical protein
MRLGLVLCTICASGCAACWAGDPYGPFLRGDSNRDGSVDISDRVTDLNALFLGGPEPFCLDWADVNDDGRFDVSDPVFGLNHLFRGGAAPPPPGPDTPGYDETDDEWECGLSPPDDGACFVDLDSDLVGLRFEANHDLCELSVEEARAGVTFTVTMSLDEAIVAVRSRPTDAGHCQRRGPSGLFLRTSIEGGDEFYGIVDTGLCAPQDNGPVTLAPGAYEVSIEWNGLNWMGPSDTGEPFGEPFPPGEYAYVIRAWGDVDGEEFFVECRMPVWLF